MRGIMLLVAVLAFFGLSGQDLPLNRVPSEVISTFNAKFPSAAAPSWQEVRTNYFETKFELNHVRHTAVVDGTGLLVMFKHKIQTSDMPAAVKQMLDSLYKDYKIGEVEQLSSMGVILYQVELLGKSPQQKILLTGNGQINNVPVFR
jgi:hypothetical protein